MGTLLDALTQENLDNQRDVVKNERRQRYDNVPYGTAWEQLFALLYPDDHPYHHLPIGSMSDLDATTLEDCRDFFTRHYAPANATLTVVGDVDPDMVIGRVEHYFGQIPTLAEAPEAPDGSIGPRAEGAHRVSHSSSPPRPATRSSASRPRPRRTTTPSRSASRCSPVVAPPTGPPPGPRGAGRLRRPGRCAGPGRRDRHRRAGQPGGDGQYLDDLAKGVEEEVARLGSDGPSDEELQRAAPG